LVFLANIVQPVRHQAGSISMPGSRAHSAAGWRGLSEIPQDRGNPCQRQPLAERLRPVLRAQLSLEGPGSTAIQVTSIRSLPSRVPSRRAHFLKWKPIRRRLSYYADV
jgi:hypothetical protein